MTIEEDQALSTPGYWDKRYAQSNGEEPTHEWFRTFSDLEPFFQNNLFHRDGFKAEDNPLIMHLGSGDSTVPDELAARGYKRQLCIDFSITVVELMAERHANIEGIEWIHLDVRNLAGFPDKSIDVAFDKGTLDAMIYGSPWSPPEEVKANAGKYLKEVHRTLKDEGMFLYVTFRQPHFMQPLLNTDGLWDLDLQVLGDKGAFDYYGFVIKKKPGGSP